MHHRARGSKVTEPGCGTAVTRAKPYARSRNVLVTLVATGALMGASAVAASPSSLVPRDGTVGGHGYRYWAAAAWRWRHSLPKDVPNKLACISARQAGPVWFLYESADVPFGRAITCRIPAGRYLMTYGPFDECSTIEPAPFHATTNAGLIHCARREWRTEHGGLSLTLDGATITPPGYLVATSVFRFTIPARNNLLGLPGRSGGRGAFYGVASILPPLSPGTHTLVWLASMTHPTVFFKIVYKLTVG
jgi:hypothetical protein